MKSVLKYIVIATYFWFVALYVLPFGKVEVSAKGKRLAAYWILQ